MIGAGLSPDSLLVSQSAFYSPTSNQTVFQALPMHEENKATKKLVFLRENRIFTNLRKFSPSKVPAIRYNVCNLVGEMPDVYNQNIGTES